MVLRRIPIRSTAISTMSPGSRYRAGKPLRIASPIDPPVTVPLPMDVAGNDAAVPRGALDHRSPGVIHEARVVVHPRCAVHLERAARVQPAVADKRRKLIGRHDPGAKRAGRVFSFGGPEARCHLVALEVAAAPVIKNREAGDVG